MRVEKRFIFVKDVEKWLKQGITEWELPEGARLTAAAADLIKERGIRLKMAVGAGDDFAPRDAGIDRNTPGASPDVQPEGATARGAIAVASSGRTPSDPIGTVAARSPYFLLFDENGAFLGSVENPHAGSGGGTGRLVAEFMAERGVRTMIAGNFGRNIKTDLEEKGIRFIEASGQSDEAVRRL
jgi:predicted Fe-Mo cluster-binding NifX family protein